MPFRPIQPDKPIAPMPVPVRARTRPSPPVEEADPVTPTALPPSSRGATSRRQHHVVDRTGPNWDDHGDYIVGKNRPPKDHRWGKGRSGNPCGPKPRAKADPANELIDEILAPFNTVVNGQTVETTAGVYGINILKAKAAQKDRLSAIALLNRYDAALRVRHPKKNEAEEISPEEQAMLDELLDTAGFDKMTSVRNRLSDTPEEATGDE